MIRDLAFKALLFFSVKRYNIFRFPSLLAGEDICEGSNTFVAEA